MDVRNYGIQHHMTHAVLDRASDVQVSSLQDGVWKYADH